MTTGHMSVNLSVTPSIHMVILGMFCLLLTMICVVTRILTGRRTNTDAEGASGAREVQVVPYSIPWLGSAIPFGLRFQDFLAEAQKSTGDSIFAIVLGGTKHNVVTAPSVTKQILNQRSTLSNTDLTYYLLTKFFGDRGTLRSVDPHVVFHDIGKQLHGLMRDPFLSKAIDFTVRRIEERTPNLVSFAGSVVDQTIWERAANIEVVRGTVPTVEASLFPLVRNFVGDLASEVLMGHNFMEVRHAQQWIPQSGQDHVSKELQRVFWRSAFPFSVTKCGADLFQNNPNILEDLWTWDAKFNLFLLGLPSWLPGLAQAVRARERARRAVQEHQEALYAVDDGRDPGSQWSDLSDVSQVMVNRAREWRKANANPIARSAGDVAILWAMNVNANQVVFWMLWHIYSDQRLLGEIRQELNRYVKVVSPISELPITESDRLDMDREGIFRFCPLLKASYLETMRLDVQGTTYKSVTADFTVTESPDDAAMAGKSKPRTYNLSTGQYVCVPHSVHQRDDRYFNEPATFNPKRFYVMDKEKPDEIVVEMGSMHPFGGGANMCKGRHFAEREVLAFAAAILATWDIEPVDGKWVHPGAKQGSGTVNPVKDVRVRMMRRRR